jgi:hypothetical protein
MRVARSWNSRLCCPHESTGRGGIP